MNSHLRHGLITLSNTTPTELIIHDEDEVLYFTSFTIQNIDNSATVYLGGADVAQNDYGFRLAPGASFSTEGMRMHSGLYAISSVNDSKVAMLRVSK